jgi:hypothetical protein
MIESCDLVLQINQILPNVINAINGNEFTGLKIEKGELNKIEHSVKEGVVILFSKTGLLIDIVYRKNVSKYLDKISQIANDNGYVFIIHSIENVKSQTIALNMIYNYIQLLLDNCDE